MYECLVVIMLYCKTVGFSRSNLDKNHEGILRIFMFDKKKVKYCCCSKLRYKQLALYCKKKAVFFHEMKRKSDLIRPSRNKIMFHLVV